MINRVVLIGRLTRDPEAPRTTTSGKSVMNFSIAVTKRIKPQDGSPDADFFNIVAWGQTAEYVANYLTKGRLVAVDGRLQARKYTTQEGQNREVVEIVAESVQGLDRPRDEEGGGRPMGGARTGGNAPAGNIAPSDDEFDPFSDD
jgi:single-strand DNA-binding protein